MILTHPRFLLFIEPAGSASNEPVIDEATRLMAAALNVADVGGGLSILIHGGKFRYGMGYRGTHSCNCGARSTAHDMLLPDGTVTNSLAVHYLACHRTEVPLEMLERVLGLQGEAEPTAEQLQVKTWCEDRDAHIVRLPAGFDPGERTVVARYYGD